MRIAVAETYIEWEDKKKNIDTAKEIISIAKNEGCDMILFPEMSFTGFSMNTNVTAENDMFTVETIGRIAKESDIIVGFGWVKSDKSDISDASDRDRKALNHYSIVSKNGTMILDYAKLHPFSFGAENDYFKSGEYEYDNNLHYLTLEDLALNIGVQICYDLRFPETFQALSKKCHIIFVPANWPSRRREHWMTLLKARAIENQCYIFGINCIGNIGGLEYSGDSMAFDYDGNNVDISKKISFDHDEQGGTSSNLYIYDLNKIDEEVQKKREAFPVKMDRRETLYERLNVSKFK